MKYFKRIAVAVGIVGLLGLTTWKLYSNKVTMNEQAAVAEMKTVRFPVTVIQPENKTISQDFQVTGDFQPSRSLKFQSESSGRVVSINFEKGDYVRRGQVLARLDDAQFNTDLELAEITLTKAKTDLGKLQTMLSSGAVNKQQVADAELNVKNAESRVTTIKRQISKCNIIAPISGQVQSKAIETGSFMSPGAMVAEIVDINHLKLSVYLSGADVVKVKKGQVVTIKPDLLQEAVLEGKVVSIGSIADGARKYEVEISFANTTDPQLKAGMTGKAVFETGAATKAMMIPAKCLTGSIQNPQVYTVSGSTAKLQKIKIGTMQDEMVQVISGLNQSDQVVSTGQLNITDGSNVNVLK